MLSKRISRGLRVANLLGLLTLAAVADAQTTYTQSFQQPPPPTTITQFDGALTSVGGSPTFDRPIDNGNLPPTSTSAVGTAVFYDARVITVTQDGNYDFTATSGLAASDPDAYLMIYQGSFDPANSLTNCLVARFGSPNATISAFHLAPGNYVIVSCAYDNGVAGTISVTATLPPIAGSPIVNVNGTTSPASSSPVFNRPFASGNNSTPPTSTSGIGTSVFYDAHPFTVATTGNYQIQATAASAWGIAAYLYATSFNPASPLTNILAGDNPTSASSVITLSQTLTAGTQYILVTTSYTNAVTGAFTNTVSPLGSVPTYDTWSGTTVGGPTFKRPSSLNGQASGAAYEYDAHTWTATVSGPVTFKSACVSPTSWDNFAILYNDTFTPATPLVNAVAYNDEFPGSSFASAAGVTYTVTAGVTYTFVTTGYYATSSSSTHDGSYAGTISGSATLGAPVLTYSGALSAGSGATYNRVNAGTPPTALSSTATAVYYTANTFTIATTGNYAVTSACVAPASWDNFLTLYKGTFSASDPLTNVVAATDGASTSSASLSPIHLTAGTYTAVTTGSANTNYGTYTLTVAPVSGGGTVANYTATLTPASGTFFNRPVANGSAAPVSLSAVGTNVIYDVHSFTVPVDGSYNLTSACVTPSAWDNFFLIYDTAFDPANPLTNAIVAVDGDTSSEATIYGVNLLASKTYLFVTTSFNNNTTGSFHNVVFTGGGVYPPAIPDDDPAGLSLTKTVTDTFSIGSLNSVTVLGLNHPFSGDLTATLTHNGITIDLFDRIGAIAAGDYGSDAVFAGDYTFAATGEDISLQTVTIDPTLIYAQYINGSDGESSTFTGDFTAFNGVSVAGDWTINVADNGIGYSGSYAGFSFTVTPDGRSVSGTIAFEGIVGAAAAQNVTFTFRPTGGGADIVKTASVAPTGVYTITGLPGGTFNLLIKGDKYLAALTTVDTTAGNQTGVNVSAAAGDANNDNSVDTTDFGVLVGAYNGDAAVPGSGYDSHADFNGDGVVDTSDFGLLVGEYNNVGAQLP